MALTPPPTPPRPTNTGGPLQPSAPTIPSLRPVGPSPGTTIPSIGPSRPADKTALVGGRIKMPTKVEGAGKRLSGREQTEAELKAAGQMALMAVPSVAQLGYGLSKDTLEFITEGITFGKYQQSPETINMLKDSFKQTFTTNPIRRYREALDNGYAIGPLILEDIGNLSIIGFGVKALTKGAVLSSAEKAAAVSGISGDAAAASKAMGRARAFERIDTRVGQFARATDKIAAAPFLATTKSLGALGKEIRTGAGYGFLSDHFNMPAGWKYGQARYDQAMKDLTDLRAAEPDIAWNDPRITELLDRASKSYTLSQSFDIRRRIRQAVKRESYEADQIRRALLNEIDNPLYKDEINPDTGEAWGELTDAEQQAIIAIYNGTASLVRWFAENTSLTPEQISIAGRHTTEPGYWLSPDGAEMAIRYLRGELSPKQYDRLGKASQTLQTVIQQATEQAIARGYGRENALPVEYMVPTPLSEHLGKKILEYGNPALIEAWNAVLENGILDRPVNDPVRMQTLQSFVNQLPVELATDSSMYPAPMRPMIEMYRRLRTSFEQRATGEVMGEPLGPRGGPPRGPGDEPMPPKRGRLGAARRAADRIEAELNKLADRIVGKTEEMARIERAYEEGAQTVLKYAIVNDYVRGMDEAALVAKYELPAEQIADLIGKNMIARQYRTAVKLAARVVEMKAALAEELRGLDPLDPATEKVRADMELEIERLNMEAENIRAEMAAALEKAKQEAIAAAEIADTELDNLARAEEELSDLEDRYEDAGGDATEVFDRVEPLTEGNRALLEREREGLLKTVDDLRAEESSLTGAAAETPPATRTALDEDTARTILSKAEQQRSITRAIGGAFWRLIDKGVEAYKRNPLKKIPTQIERAIFEKAKRDNGGVHVVTHKGKRWWTDTYVIGLVDGVDILDGITEDGRYIHDETSRSGGLPTLAKDMDAAPVGSIIDSTIKNATQPVTLDRQVGNLVIGAFGDGQIITFSKELLQMFDDGNIQLLASESTKPVLVKRGKQVIGVIMPNRIGATFDLSGISDLSVLMDLVTLNPEALLDVNVNDKARAKIYNDLRPMLGLGKEFGSTLDAPTTPKTTASVTRLKVVQREIGAAESRLKQIDSELAADAKARLRPVEETVSRTEEAPVSLDGPGYLGMAYAELQRIAQSPASRSIMPFVVEQTKLINDLFAIEDGAYVDFSKDIDFSVLDERQLQLVDSFVNDAIALIKRDREQISRGETPQGVQEGLNTEQALNDLRQLKQRLNQALGKEPSVTTPGLRPVETPTLRPVEATGITPELQAKLDRAEQIYQELPIAKEQNDWSTVDNLNDELDALADSLTPDEKNALATPLERTLPVVFDKLQSRVWGDTIRIDIMGDGGLDIVSNTNGVVGGGGRYLTKEGTYINIIIEPSAVNPISSAYNIPDRVFNPGFTIENLIAAIDIVIEQLPEMYAQSAKRSGADASYRAIEINPADIDSAYEQYVPEYGLVPNIIRATTLNQGQFKKTTSLPEMIDVLRAIQEELRAIQDQTPTLRDVRSATAGARDAAAVRPDSKISDPEVRDAVYRSDVADALAPQLAAKMDEAKTMQEKLEAFGEYIKAAQQARDALTSVRDRSEARLVRAEGKQAEREAKLARLFGQVEMMQDRSQDLQARLDAARSTEDYRLATAFPDTGSIPLDIALGDVGFTPFGIEMPGMGVIESVGPIYIPTGKRPDYAGGARTEVIRSGLDGWRRDSSERFRAGDRQTIFSLREVALRLGDSQQRLTSNESYKAIVSIVGQKIATVLGVDDAFFQEMYERAYQQALQYDEATRLRLIQNEPELWQDVQAESMVDGVGAYAPGNANPAAVFNAMVRRIYGEMLSDEMYLRGYDPIDPYAAIGKAMRVDKINQETMFVPQGFTALIGRVTAPVRPTWWNNILDGMNRITQGMKTTTLVLSLTWQLGDLVSAIILAQMTGVDVPVMIERMKQVVDAEYGGGFDPSMVMPSRNMPTPTDLGRLLQESPVQDISLQQAERQRLLGIPGVEDKQLGFIRRNARRVADVSYRINETVNRITRHAYFLELLDRALTERGLTLDDIVRDRALLRDESLRTLLFDVADDANKWLGDFANLDTKERRILTPLIPFYSWTKHIHKVFMALGQEHPSSIRWYLTLGTLYYDPEQDPLGIRTGMPVFGGFASTGFLNPLGDVFAGPIGSFLAGEGLRAAGQTLGPIPRLIGGLVDVDVAGGGGGISRPPGTGTYSSTGQMTYGGINPIKSPEEFAGFTLQQFPIATRTMAALPALNRVLPGEPIPENIPGTRIALGPVARYQTGEARTRPGAGQRRIEQPGGDLAAVARLFSVPFVPYRSEEQARDIEKAARARLRTLETLRRRRENLGPP